MFHDTDRFVTGPSNKFINMLPFPTQKITAAMTTEAAERAASCWPMAVRLAQKFGFYRNRHFSEEISHDAAVAGLIRAANEFDEKRGVRFRTFAFRCIKNEVRKAWQTRRHKLDATLAMSDPVNAAGESLIASVGDAGEESPLDLMEAAERYRVIDGAISELKKSNKRDAVVIRMYFFGGFNDGEIGRHYGVSRAAIHQRRMRGLEFIRWYLTTVGFDHGPT